MRFSFFILLYFLFLFSCNVKTNRLINEESIWDEIGSYSDDESYVCSCIYNDSLFHIVIQKSALYYYVKDSLFFYSDSTAIGSSRVSRWSENKEEPIYLNDHGYQSFSFFAVNDSLISELRSIDHEKFIKENYYDVKYFHGNPYYEFGSDLTLEWEFILIEKGYKIFVDCESGFLVVTKRTDK